MAILDQLQGAIIGLDTVPLIYFIEKHPTYHPFIRPFFSALADGSFTAVTSTVTLAEVLVLPLRLEQLELVRHYREILLQSQHLTMYSLTPEIATKAAEIRAIHNLRTPDAIQLATAIQSGATFFLTNDLALQRYSDLQILIVENLR